MKTDDIQPTLDVLLELHDDPDALEEIRIKGCLQHSNVSQSAIAGIVRYLMEIPKNSFTDKEKTIMNEIVYRVSKDDDILNRFADDMDLSDKVLAKLESKITKLMEKTSS